MTAAMAAGTTVPARPHVRPEGPRHHWRAGPTGAHAGRKWSREDEHSARRTVGTAGSKHAVVMTEGLIMPGDCGASKEDDRHDENDARDNHHPRRHLVEPRRLRQVRRHRRGGGRRLDLVLGYLGHPLIMPTWAPTIKRRALGVAARLPS